MAESYDRNDLSSSITDDMIKEALKSGLSSIKASDYLIESTLEKCQAEITEDKQKKKSITFMTMAYKLGAPLAAGALVLMLMINGPKYFSSKMEMAAPKASSLDGSVSNEEYKMDSGFSVSADSETQAPDAYMYEFTEPKEKNDDSSYEDSAGTTMMRINESITALNSSINRTANSTEPSLDESFKSFNAITDLYNENNGTKLTLERDNVRRIYTLLETGVSTDTLLNAGDYHEVLSGDGYWALPLENNRGDIEVVLTANMFDVKDPNIPVSNRDTIYSIENKEFIVSPLDNSNYIGSELQELFEFDSLFGMISEMGYEYGNDTEMIVADINYGADFIVLLSTGNEKNVIPFLTNETLFGVENKKIYLWSEFVKIVSTSMGQ